MDLIAKRRPHSLIEFTATLDRKPCQLRVIYFSLLPFLGERLKDWLDGKRPTIGRRFECYECRCGCLEYKNKNNNDDDHSTTGVRRVIKQEGRRPHGSLVRTMLPPCGFQGPPCDINDSHNNHHSRVCVGPTPSRSPSSIASFRLLAQRPRRRRFFFEARKKRQNFMTRKPKPRPFDEPSQRRKRKSPMPDGVDLPTDGPFPTTRWSLWPTNCIVTCINSCLTTPN